jgi:hypothetical protein
MSYCAASQGFLRPALVPALAGARVFELTLALFTVPLEPVQRALVRAACSHRCF